MVYISAHVINTYVHMYLYRKLYLIIEQTWILGERNNFNTFLCTEITKKMLWNTYIMIKQTLRNYYTWLRIDK